jgi:hypothetical protein
MKSCKVLLLGILAMSCVGCGGSGKAIMPEGEMTAEQIEAVKAEDQAIEDEEMGGGMAPVKARKK